MQHLHGRQSVRWSHAACCVSCVLSLCRVHCVFVDRVGVLAVLKGASTHMVHCPSLGSANEPAAEDAAACPDISSCHWMTLL